MKYVTGWIVKKTEDEKDRKWNRENAKREKLGKEPLAQDAADEEYLGKKAPYLGKMTCDHTSEEAEATLAPWVFAVSKGGLYVGSKDFSSDVEQFENEFLQFHGKSGLQRGTMIIDRFAEVLVKKFENYERKLLALFSKTRTHFEIRHMIQKLAKEKAEKAAKNAAKRAENEEKRFRSVVENEAEKLIKKREAPDGANVTQFEPTPKKPRLTGRKTVRDHVKLGHNST